MGTVLFCDLCGAALVQAETRCHACGASQISSQGKIAPSTQKLISPPPPLPITTPAPISPCTLAPGSLLAQRYRIVSVVGQGGFATVYKARDRAQRNRLIAIKQIHLETLDLHAMLDATDAYNREVNTLSRLRSKYLPRIHHHFMDEQHWYIVLEYIKGQTLEEKLLSMRRGFLPVAQVLEIGIAMCEALQHLHMQQPPLIFRDVKPANMILAHSGRLYLIDFGTTRRYRPGWKDTGPLGTPGYAAPEQYGKRAHTTPQTDIYGLGATLQTLLTGKDPLEIRASGIPAERARKLPPKLLDELAHMQANDATRRPRNMTEVKAVLQEIRAQALDQRIKATGAFIREQLHETSAFAYMALILLIFVDVAAFIDMTWRPLWLVSLAIIIVFTWLRGIFALRSEAQEKQAALSTQEKIETVWKQATLALPVSLVISLLIYYLLYMLSLLDTYTYDDYVTSNLINLAVIVGGAIIGGAWWAIARLVRLRAERKHARQKQQEMVIQQTIRNHP